ncbi:MAG: transposase [Panacagrimonas sp.]
MPSAHRIGRDAAARNYPSRATARQCAQSGSSTSDRRARWGCIYNRHAKRELVEAAQLPGVSVARLAMDHAVNANLLRKWVTAYQAETRSATGRTTPSDPDRKDGNDRTKYPCLAGRYGAWHAARKRHDLHVGIFARIHTIPHGERVLTS